MRTSTIIVLFFFLNMFTLNGQVFWEEDFRAGIPTDWEVSDLSGQRVFWTWCSNPESGENDDDCPFIYDNFINEQKSFAATTAKNGFAVVNSEIHNLSLDISASPHESVMTTSAIDCTGQENVFINFESHIGVAERDAMGAKFLVSNDKETWTEFLPFPNLRPDGHIDPNFKRWSYNPYETIIDISAIASNKETVYLRWYWLGNWEFYWAIDDVMLTTENIKRKIDLSLKPNGAIHGIPANYKTPISQMEPIFFATDVSNNGIDPMENVPVNVKIFTENGGSLIYEDTEVINFILPGETIEDILFSPYNHDQSLGKFNIEYSVGNLEEDEFQEDNIKEYAFEVSLDLFQKENGKITTGTIVPNLEYWDGENIYPWSIANYFYLPKGDGFFLKEIEFGVPDYQVLAFNIFCNSLNEKINIDLYEWEDENLNGTAELEERKLIGTQDFIISGDDGMFNIFEGLKDPENGSLNIPLKDNMAYLVVLDYDPNRINQCFKTFGSSDIHYEGMINTTATNGQPRFASLMAVGEETDLKSPGLDPGAIPLIRMHIQDKPVSTREVLIHEKVFNLSPLPADEIIKLDLDASLKSKITGIYVFNALGQSVFQSDEYVQNIDTSNFDSGIYSLKLVMNSGETSTQLFLVKH